MPIAKPRPMITTPREAVESPSGEILLIEDLWMPFIQLMDRLFPHFISSSESRGGGIGWSAFQIPVGSSIQAATFIGSFAGAQLQSPRKNPWFEDREQLFLRAILAAYTLTGVDTFRSKCKPNNYGTMGLWRIFGVGGRLDHQNKVNNVPLTEESAKLLDDLRDKCRAEYYDIRRSVALRLPHINPAGLIPTVEQMVARKPDVAMVRMSCRLLPDHRDLFK